MKPTAFIFSGKPGSGKTTIAKELAKHFKAAYFRLDTIEHGLTEVCGIDKIDGKGYRLTYRIVADNLNLGNDVVIDCCNPWKLTRDEWEAVAVNNNGAFLNIEINCDDINEREDRYTNRANDIEGFTFPAWGDVIKRDYHDWDTDVIQVETSNRSVEECVKELLLKVENKRETL